MNALLTIFSLLSFLALIMLVVSAFTPRTAWFLKAKSKGKGALLWLGVLLVSFFVVGILAPPPQQTTTVEALAGAAEEPAAEPASSQTAQSLPAYKAEVTDKVPGTKLALDCTINEPVDEATLRALGQKVYAENGGQNYKRVFIMWYLPNYQKGNGAWGTTNFTDDGGVPDVRIMALQG